MSPEWKDVQSSDLARVLYFPKTELLLIEFKNPPHALYAYAEVEYVRYRGLMKAKSKGKYFHRWIRGHYKYQQVEWIDAQKAGLIEKGAILA